MTSAELLAQLRAVMRYDPESGQFFGIDSGRTLGHLKDGYIVIYWQGRFYRRARLACLFMTGDFPPRGQEVDHINTNRSDDRWSNLRLVTRSQNNRNPSGPRANNTIGAKGVHRQPNGTFFARITVDGKIIHLGTFRTIEEAANARREADERYAL